MPAVAPSSAESLAGVAVRGTVRVRSVTSPESAQTRRLAEFGVRPGAQVTVLARTAGGGRLVGVGASRIVLDAGTAAQVQVDR